MQITSENYFSKEANQAYFSNSQYKGFLECEAKEVAKLGGAWIETGSKAMLQGRYVHAWNEGKLAQFKAVHPELFKKDGSLYADFDVCNSVIDTIKRDDLFMLALSGQKEAYFTAEMFGAPWKILIDSYFPDGKRFGDLKVLRALDEKFWNKSLHVYENVFEYRGYYTQMAIYAAVERIANNRPEGDYFEPFIAVATKDEYPDKAIVSFVSAEESQEAFIARQLTTVEANMPRFIAIKAGKEKPRRCEACDYCRSTKKLTGTVHYTHFNLE